MRTLRRAAVSVLWAFSERRMLVVLWLLTAVLSLGAAAPWAAPLRKRLDHSLVGRGGDGAASDLLVELARVVEATGPAGGAALGFSALLVLLLSPGLAAGALGRLLRGGRFETGAFLRDAAEGYWRNVRVLLWAVAGLAPLVALGAVALVALGRVEEQAVVTAPFARLRLALGGAGLVAFLYWRTLLDLARAVVALEGERRTRRAAWRALKTVIRRPGVVLGQALVAGLGLGVAWLLVRAHAAIPARGAGGVWLGLGVVQLLVFVRGGFWAAGYAYALEVAGSLPPLPPRPERKRRRALADPAPRNGVGEVA